MTEILRWTIHSLAAETHGAGHEGKAAEHGIGWYMFFYVGLTFLILGVFMALARRDFKSRYFTSKPAQFSEQLYLFLQNITVNVIGPHGTRYVPFLMAIWMFIFVSNLTGLFLKHNPTADWSINLGLSIITMAYVTFEGMRANGVVGYFRHFAGPKLPLATALLVGMIMFPVELMSEFIKIFSLSLRLYFNMEGGHIVKSTIDGMAFDGAIPLGALLVPIKLLTCVVQALVWVMLTSVYIGLVTSHDEEHEEEHEHAEGHGHELQPA